jgi:hypothetical protein
MAIYSLLFGHAEWPEEKRPGSPLPSEFGARPKARRLTVTVPDTLKRCVEESAALEGVPADTWIVRALSRSVDPRLLEVAR